MKVSEAIALLSYGTEYEIRGAYSGKVYHKSWSNKKDHVEPYLNNIVSDSPFYINMRMTGASDYSKYCKPYVGIWMCDYNLCKDKESEEQA